MSTDQGLSSIFEERAENLRQDDLLRWTAYTPGDRKTLRKLTGPGAKLITGPRGSGKSTLLRTAYFRLLSDQDSLPAYVNYARSLALEPLFHKQANALQLFRQWVLLKVIVAVADSFGERDQKVPPELRTAVRRARSIIHDLSVGVIPTLETLLSPEDLVASLERWADSVQARRVIVLMDDAAHAFSPEQQREFFEIFRELRSRRVSCKAAVYPGITSYSPHFHVGHEAELLEAWYRPDEEEYLVNMRGLVARRLPEHLQARLAGREELIDYLALASFGLPRGFLNMLSQLVGADEDDPKPTRHRAEIAVSEHAESVRGIFRALAAKLPRFRHFIQVGTDLEEALIRSLRTYNRLQDDSGRKAVVVGLEDAMEPQLERILNMLEYAGLVRKVGSVSRGEKGRFIRYAVHHALVLADGGLSLGKSFPLSQAIKALSTRDAHAFARTRASQLLGPKFTDRCKLDLPPCRACSAPRIAEDQHFCMKCGAELTNASVYEELLRHPVDALPLPAAKIEGIRNHTGLRTVQDVLLDDDVQMIRKVPYVGPVWAARIRTVAEEFVSV
ncbi:hypothetical protein [Sorangium sp. So ce693]|uniref:hypothetical protein n=1 Tax=Sorangium sp. So ce693 TaxID=3133318 RepID=UPI003F5D69C8